jgi:hypothetical protein
MAPIVMAFTNETYWLYNHHFYALLYLIFTSVWIGLAILMTLEQERHLTQVWYCHQFFWVTNCIFVTLFSIISLATQVYPSDDYGAFAFAGAEIIVSALTVGYMLKTKSLRLRRLEENLSPLNRSSDKIGFIKSTPEGYIDISLEYRINKKNEVHFKLNAGKVSTRVKRSLKEFLKVEDYLIKFLDSKMPELTNKVPSIEHGKIGKFHSDHTSLYESRLRSLDKFLQTLADTPELWTRDILIFLGIDKGAYQAIYLQKRSDILQRKKEVYPENPLGLPYEDCGEDSYQTNSYHIDAEAFPFVESEK